MICGHLFLGILFCKWAVLYMLAMYAISSTTMRVSKGKETSESVEEKSESVEEKSESVDAPQVPHRNMEEAVLGPYW